MLGMIVNKLTSTYSRHSSSSPLLLFYEPGQLVKPAAAVGVVAGLLFAHVQFCLPALFLAVPEMERS